MVRLFKTEQSPERPAVDIRFLCTAAVAALLCLYITFGKLTDVLYGNLLSVCCLVFLGATLERGMKPAGWKVFLLAAAMALWYVILMIHRREETTVVPGLGLFLSSYLFALPFGFLAHEKSRDCWLKFFGAAYLAGSVALAGFSYLLILDCLPEFLKDYIYWDGARLCAFRHPNIVACFFMIGVGFDLSFFLAAKKPVMKILFAAVLIFLMGAMAFTNSRTTILLTGAILGCSLCLSFFKGRWKYLLLGVAIVLAVIFGVYTVFGQLYQNNHNQMLEKYTEQYQQQQNENGDHQSGGTETEETIPVYVDPTTGNIMLQTESGQGSLFRDVRSLNGRTETWKAAFQALKESPELLLWGTGNPGACISQYRPEHSVVHAHNSWIESLLGLGLPGFAIVMIITVFTLRNCLLVLWKDYADVWKRNTALLVLGLMVAAILEPYLFLATITYHAIDMIFLICAGYLFCWKTVRTQ